MSPAAVSKLDYSSVTQWLISLLLSVLTQLLEVSFLSVCPLIDHKLRHNIVKVVVDSPGSTLLELYFHRTMITCNSIVHGAARGIVVFLVLLFSRPIV